MYYVCDYDGIRKEFDTFEEADAWLQSRPDCDDMWISCDEDCEPDDIDSDFGFDAYEGCYTYDCQVWHKNFKKGIDIPFGVWYTTYMR